MADFAKTIAEGYAVEGPAIDLGRGVHEGEIVQEAAVRNIRAGVDIVLTTGRGSYNQVYRALLSEARRDPAFRARVKESAERVVALQQSLR